MTKYLDYLRDSDVASSAPFDQIDEFLDDDLGHILDEEHRFTTSELERQINHRSQLIEEKQKQIDAKQAKTADQIQAEQEKIEKLESEWQSLKKEGYQPPEEEQRMAQIRDRIEHAEDRIHQWERWCEDRQKSLREEIDELQRERSYYESKLREVRHDQDLLRSS